MEWKESEIIGSYRRNPTARHIKELAELNATSDLAIKRILFDAGVLKKPGPKPTSDRKSKEQKPKEELPKMRDLITSDNISLIGDTPKKEEETKEEPKPEKKKTRQQEEKKIKPLNSVVYKALVYRRRALEYRALVCPEKEAEIDIEIKEIRDYMAQYGY